MRTIRLTLEYDGSDYHGWQLQPGVPTVQGTVEEAVKKLSGEEVRLRAAGRTDAGVHALGQVASFETRLALPADKIRSALNAFLPKDIAVLEAEEAPPSFHPQYSAKEKTYKYLILNRPLPSPLWRRYCWHVRTSLELEAMQEAASCFIGSHDFTAFSSSGDEVHSSVRTVRESRIEREGELLTFWVTADGFLRYMVRTMVGTLVLVGRGKLPPGQMAALLSSGDRGRAGPVAPARGLYLVRVCY